MKKILLPTDFSDNALKAALYAAQIATRGNAVIHFLHVVEEGVEKIRQPFALHEKYSKLVQTDREKDLAIFRENVTKVYNKIKTKVALEEGEPVTSILHYCAYNKIDLVVMGTRGAGKIKELLVGTVAAGVVAKSKVPVLVVPEKYKTEKPDGILFATNHFEKNKSLLEMITAMAKLFSAAVHVVVFVNTDKAEAGDYVENNRKMDYYLRFLEKTYPGINFMGEVVEGRDFEDAIEWYHAAHETDMAAMITYPKGFWEKVFHKSATKKMIYHSGIPVLAIPFSIKKRPKTVPAIPHHS